jgi:hypothetical protein
MLNTRKKYRLCITILVAVTFCLIIINNKKRNLVFFDENTQLYSIDETNESNYLGKEFCSEDTLHSICFLGRTFCHPGYFGDDCSLKRIPSNPWYSEDCPNLKLEITYSKHMPFELISQGKKCLNENLMSGISKCAYLCFSHPMHGVAQVPLAYWKRVSMNEVEAWKLAEGVDDRGIEHKLLFNNYADLPENLGKFIEIGAGPYTQTQFILNKKFESITFLGF